jgi:type II secretory pathway pseudopilin PulG
MVVLLVAMAAAAIWMSAALPAWRQQAQRQKEEDLIFRGEQYARAIVLFQRKNNGAYPPSIDLLVDQHYLRKKWKDPIAKEDFVPVGPGIALPGAAAGGAPAAPGRGQAPAPQAPGRAGGAPGAGGAAQGAQQPGITGVRSKSQDTSLKIYQNQQQYSMWPFDAMLQWNKMGYFPNARGAGPGGQPATGGGPGGPGGDRGGGAGRGGPGGARPGPAAGPGAAPPRGGGGGVPPPAPGRRGGGGG